MKNSPREMLAEAKEIRRAVKSLRKRNVIDGLIRRGISPDRIDRTIRDAEVAAEVITNQARARIAHRKRAKLRIVKS